MDNTVQIKVPIGIMMRYRKEILTISECLDKLGYHFIVVPDCVDIDTSDMKVSVSNDTVVCNFDGEDIIIDDIINIIEAKRQAEEEFIDLVNQEEYPDPVAAVENHIIILNDLIQNNFPDNDVLKTEIVLCDDYVEKAIDGLISYTINSNHPDFLNLLNNIQQAMPDEDLLAALFKVFTHTTDSVEEDIEDFDES